MSGEFQRVADLADLAVKGMLCVEFGGVEVLLCRTADGVFAVDNLCTHAEARLCDGRLKGNRVHCPLHGAAFDVRDGSALSRPASIPLATYELRQEGEQLSLRMPADD